MPETHPSSGGEGRTVKIVRWAVWLLILALSVWFVVDLIRNAP
jgi:hypothetical protein